MNKTNHSFDAGFPLQCRSQRGAAVPIFLGVLATAAAVASAVAWGMHIMAKSPGVPAYSKPAIQDGGAQQVQTASREAVARMFGGATPTATGSRDIEGLHLLGIVADKRGAGVALMSVDGAPPIRVRVGGRVRDGVTLAEIRERKVVLERGGGTVELALPLRGNSPAAAKGPGTSGISQSSAVAPPAGHKNSCVASRLC